MPILGDAPQAIEYPITGSFLIPSAHSQTIQVDSIPHEPIFSTSTLIKSPEQVIRTVFGKDAPVMLRIAQCESDLKQHGEDGEVLKGNITPLDRGVFQISLKYHQEEIDTLELDVHVLEDNVRFAKTLFDRNGTQDWYLSEKCWHR